MATHSLFWAKTRLCTPFADGPHAPYKPVGHHLLDVAAVAGRYLVLNPGRLRRESAISGLLPDQHVLLCTALAALHDLGKISPWFQAQSPLCWPAAALGAMPAAGRPISHWQATAVLFGDVQIRRTLQTKLPEFALGDQMIAAVAGHHGKAPDSNYLGGNAGFHRAAIGEPCVAIADALCEEILKLLLPAPINEPAALQIETFSFSLNGLITLADWVGSDSEAFPFEDPAMPLADYWLLALTRADAALRSKGLVPAKPMATPVLSHLSPRAGNNPRPMQRKAAELVIGDRPQLILIEDGTGSGKTEAALLLAARMMAAGQGEGVYVALPTMATANAMHERLDAALAGLFDETGGRSTSLVLAHGKASLAMALDSLAAGGDAGQGREEAVSQRFNAWIGDSRKKAFFADAGAGTIDQAFLAILPKKHLTLRQYALAGRILIVDEAHACDAYMGEELKTLVEMQARFGGSVIILSATLGEMMRRQLILAFARGRGIKNRHIGPLERWAPSQAYPLLTRYAGGERIEEMPVEALASLSRRVGIARLPDREASLALALEAAKRGACVAIICNAVDSAIAVHAALALAGHPADRLTLFHARFAVGDRMAIEERVLQLFGPKSGLERRAGQILVATQVVEQSLDLDFDVMISDLAPVDLMIQRAGRLWRHSRDGRLVPAPVLHVVSPEPLMATDADWLKETLGPAAYTYDLPGVLWRTARDLFARGRLDTPEDLRRLVEAAYRPEGDDLPDGLLKAHDASLGKGLAEKFQGQHNTIDPRAGYAGMREVSADEEIGTRLREKSVTLRLGKKAGSTLAPLVCRQGASEAMNWALSEISVRHRWLAGKGNSDHSALPASADPAAVDAVRAAWPEWERCMPLYVVGEDGGLMTVGQDGLDYDAQTGLRWLEEHQAPGDGHRTAN
ncbi:CRISPR-associated helicase Cas3' [Agrobacterium sp. a22-2]|uniref:CRISPR-associated helicase Cas3' n=1 Tax=Agrobacterium sp. a22-2 TaxID=2283840 RepID=UPI001445B8FC|nr:CRISPR-associated helicase Cas3' [Agrobacterium sp. a22-2]NKN38465.1 CRISPR-associated helicase Cas3' [Agrobacterium sp. a22-2]